MKKIFLLLSCVWMAFGATAQTVEPIPTVTAPDSEHMLLLVRVNSNINVCNTIAMRGRMTSFLDGNPVLFEKVANTNTWYQALMPVYTNADFWHCKLMLVDEAGVASYDYEGTAGTYELLNNTDRYLDLDDDFGTENCLSMIEEVDCSGKILYVAINSFNSNPCIATSTYHITLRMAYNVADNYQPAVSGNLNSWGVTAMNQVSDEEWDVEVSARPGNQFKFQSTQGGWQNQIQQYNAERQSWDDMNNLSLGNDLNPVFDFSDQNLYRWYKAGLPQTVYKDVTISARVPSDWTHCYVWAWYNNYFTGVYYINVFDSWPGQELPIVNGKVTYTFEQVGTPLNIIFSSGAGSQTYDIENITESTCYELLYDNYGQVIANVVDCPDGSQLWPIYLDAQTYESYSSSIVADFIPNEETRFLYVWEISYFGAEATGLNFYNNTAGYLSLVVGYQGWSGAGFNLSAQQDWQAAESLRQQIVQNPDDYYLHLAIKSTDSASHEFRFLNNNSDSKFVLGTAPVDYSTTTEHIYSDFPRDGEWHDFFIPMTRFATSLSYPSITSASDIFEFLSGGVAGTQLNLDAIYFCNTLFKNKVEESGATPIHQITGSSSQQATKILHNGQILILRGDKTYTVTGQVRE